MYKIEFLDIEENDEMKKTISKVLEECFKVENLPKDKTFSKYNTYKSRKHKKTK